ncbi:uncharacterized protein [Dysidea avara]|uniref:uncharacterized protein n=1 Tax=Dysidea avara TaxID=196820 RepID=UPI0033347350
MDINPRSTSSDIDTGGTCVGMKSALPLQSIGNKPQSMKKDPLEAAKRHPLGRPRLKRPRREKWNFPMRVSEETSEALLSIRKHQLDIKASLMETSTQDKEILTKRDCKENCTGDTYTKQYSGQGNSVNKETKDTNRKGVNSRKCKCSGCSLLDCGLCTFCKDMIKFGGPGKKKQRCSKRKCVMKDDRSTLYSKPTTPSVSNSSPLNFLEKSGRTIKQIVPDGNCFFRAVSFHILGDEDKHCSVRAEVLKFEQRNEHMLAKFLMLPANKPSFQEHIRFLQRPDTWATQVEVIAVATMFSVAVFYCRKQDSLYHWEVINPLTCPSVSDVQGDGFPGAAIPHHFELYWDGSHYDCVVLQSTGMCSNSTPVLSGTVSYVDIT